jgi:type II secretory pathway component GspD/PulD (secretin)
MKRRVVLPCLLLVAAAVVFSQEGKASLISFEFINQDIRDILYAFSSYARISIIADETVNGNATFQFNGTSFEQAFDMFLLTNRLYVDKTEAAWIVSRIYVEVSSEGSITLNSLDAGPGQTLEKLSRKLKVAIIPDSLPMTTLSLHLESPSLYGLVSLLMKPFTEYEVVEGAGHIRVRKIPPTPYTPSPLADPGRVVIHEAGGMYEVEVERANLGTVLEQFFSGAGREYVSFVRSDYLIERIKFGGKAFEAALELILEQGNGEYREISDICYIFPRQQADIITGLKDEGKSWRRFDVKHLGVSDVLAFIHSRYNGAQTITLPGEESFLVFADEGQAASMREYITSLDNPRSSEPIRLNYIKTEDLYQRLPPSARREDLVDAGNGNTFFFLGTPERLAVFLKDLELIDRPQPRIRYDIFIIQVQETTGLTWSSAAELRDLRPGDNTMITGQLGNLLSLNFDIITVFGYQFAAKINAALAENQASVFADTTLFGLSGQTIKFQNTSTYRYRDSNIDPDTGRPIYSGITREIVSGLVLEIGGWVSGDGMITIDVTASVSKRGADVSSSIGNPPPTFEKILTTQIRARSGETVVLSGLRQNDETMVEERIPFISRIPILGWLFKGSNTTKEKTQMIIYLVPHVDMSSEEYTVEGLKTASIYTRFVEPFLESPHESAP